MNYHNITHDDQNNGDGLRVVLWLSGCDHKCKGCQNPQTWDKNSGILFDKNAKEEIFEELSKDYISGITFSGGDPLNKNNNNEVFLLCTEIRKNFPNKTIWLYSGYTWEEVMNSEELKKTVSLTDVFVDGKFIKELYDKSYHWAGSTNQRVIDIKESLNKNDMTLLEN